MKTDKRIEHLLIGVIASILLFSGVVIWDICRYRVGPNVVVMEEYKALSRDKWHPDKTASWYDTTTNTVYTDYDLSRK